MTDDKQKKLNEKLVDEAMFGDLEKVKELLKQGADINGQDLVGYSPLMAASTHMKDEVVEYLIENGANLDLKDDEGNTTLMRVCKQGLIPIIKILIKAGANLDLKNKYGKTALMNAAINIEGGFYPIIKILLDSGADLNIKYKGKTVIDMAKKQGIKSTVEILEEYQNRAKK